MQLPTQIDTVAGHEYGVTEGRVDQYGDQPSIDVEVEQLKGNMPEVFPTGKFESSSIIKLLEMGCYRIDTEVDSDYDFDVDQGVFQTITDDLYEDNYAQLLIHGDVIIAGVFWKYSDKSDNLCINKDEVSGDLVALHAAIVDLGILQQMILARQQATYMYLHWKLKNYLLYGDHRPVIIDCEDGIKQLALRRFNGEIFETQSELEANILAGEWADAYLGGMTTVQVHR